MANYAQLKAAIDQVIKANGQQEITGPVLNQVLKAMVDSLGAGYILAGVATPSTNPGTPDQDVYWLAYQGGTYTNFGGAQLPTGISMLKWNGSWAAQTFFTVDDQLTPNSNNLAKSGAAFDAVMQSGVFDLSAYNSGAEYADLSAALTALNSLPAAYKRGGMSIKFVQSSDNKYVQYRLMLSTFTNAQFANPENWQGVEENPIQGSNNLVKSGGIADAIQLQRFILEGKGDGRISQIQLNVLPNHTYIVDVLGNDTFGVATAGNTGIGLWWVQYDDNGTLRNIERETKAEGQTSFTVSRSHTLGQTTGTYYFGGRIDVGYKLEFLVRDITFSSDYFEQMGKDGFYYSYKFPVNGEINKTFRAVKGHIYRLVCLNRHWTASKIGTSGSIAFGISLNGSYLYKITGAELFYGRIPQPYEFIAEDDNDYKILARADAGTVISYAIYDITDNIRFDEVPTRDSDNLLSSGTIFNLLNQKLDFVLNGNDGNAVTKDFVLDAGKCYKITLSQKSWSSNNHSFPSPGGVTKFQILYHANNTDTPILFNRIVLTEEGLPYYSYNFIAVEADYYRIFFRGDVGVKIDVTVEEYDSSVVALNGGKEKIRENLSNMKKPYPYNGTTPLSLLFFSDLHFSMDNLNRLVEFNDIFKEYIDDILSGGDNVNDQANDTWPFQNSLISGSAKILTAIGNHDAMINNEVLTSKEVFDLAYGTQTESWTGVTFPNNYQTLGLCYWYKDYANSKIRLITLDCMHYDNDQHDWLDSVLDDAVLNDYQVVICSHYPPKYEVTGCSDCTFNSTYPWQSQYLDGRASALVHEKCIDATSPLKFVCWLSGHVHKDYFGYITEYPEQYYICIDKCSDSGNERDFYPRNITTAGAEKDSDVFNVISFNAYLGILCIYRIGNNTDCFDRKKNYLSFDYINHKIIGNS